VPALNLALALKWPLIVKHSKSPIIDFENEKMVLKSLEFSWI